MIRRWLASVLALSACGGDGEPRSQWLIELGTDAPIPLLGDRILIEIGESCGGCRRTFSVESAADFPLSFGVTEVEPKPRIRARLFRASQIGPEGLPIGGALIESVAELPSLGSNEVRRVTLNFEAQCFGKPADLAAGTACRGGQLAPIAELEPTPPLVAGSWAPAVERPCAGTAPPGALCVPGGVFLFGDPLNEFLPGEEQSTPELLVELSPFYLDRDEVTVGAYRSVGSTPAPLSKGDPSLESSMFCTFLGANDGANDAMPLNCLGREAAEAFCATRGMRLPSEAEWEFAAANRNADTSYAWGDDPDVCSHALVGRSPAFQDVFIRDEFSFFCRSREGPTLDPGPVAGGSSADATALGLINLGGSMSEWTSDDFAARDHACWPSATPARDPACVGGDGTARASVRGGNWAGSPILARSTRRFGLAATESVTYVGLRCAKSAS